MDSNVEWSFEEFEEATKSLLIKSLEASGAPNLGRRRELLDRLFDRLEEARDHLGGLRNTVAGELCGNPYEETIDQASSEATAALAEFHAAVDEAGTFLLRGED